MSRGKKWKLREQLFNKQGGLCWWCEKPMMLMLVISMKQMKKWSKENNLPADLCTIDHIRDKNKVVKKTVAACITCNSLRGLQGL